MSDSNIIIFNADGGSAQIDLRTVGTEGRQVVIVGDPTTNANVAEVRNDDPGSSSTLQGMVVRLAGSATVVGLQGTTARPFLMNTDGAIKIYDIVDGTVGVENITRVRNLVDGTLSLVTRVDRVMNLIDGTLSTVTGIDRVRNIVDGTISTVDTITRVNRVFNLIDGTISFVPVVQRVQNVVDGTLTTVTGVDRIRNVVDGTISTIDTAIRVNRVFNIVDGTISLANIQSTASIFTVSSSMTGSYPSGQTIVAPSASYNFKVFAISITTTAQTQNVVTLMNGGGTPTEFWRVALQAPTAGIAGANLAVSPPGYIFATGTNTTLAIRADAGSLIHYSVSYRKESA